MVMKKRYCMTLDDELMKKLDRFLDGSKFKNRSQTAEFFMKLALSQYRPERSALILCGGLGTRLRPLTFVTPKPMLPIGNQPLLEYQINYLKKYEFDRIVLAVGYLQEQIVRYFLDGQKFGVKIAYSFEKDPLDTGGAVKNAEDLLNSDFIAMNSDVLFDSLDLDRLFEFHKSREAVATVALVKTNDTSRFGVVKLEADDALTEFIEKPRRPIGEPGWINAGVYAFSTKIFDYVKPEQRVSLEKNVFPKLAKERRVYGFKYEGYWSDMGTQEDYIEVVRDILTGKLKV